MNLQEYLIKIETVFGDIRHNIDDKNSIRASINIINNLTNEYYTTIISDIKKFITSDNTKNILEKIYDGLDYSQYKNNTIKCIDVNKTIDIYTEYVIGLEEYICTGYEVNENEINPKDILIKNKSVADKDSQYIMGLFDDKSKTSVNNALVNIESINHILETIDILKNECDNAIDVMTEYTNINHSDLLITKLHGSIIYLKSSTTFVNGIYQSLKLLIADLDKSTDNKFDDADESNDKFVMF